MSFFDELVESLGRVQFARLPEVAAAIREASSTEQPTTAAPPVQADAFAQAILSAPTKGSKLDVVARAVIAHALEQTQGNVSAAARLLGVDRKFLERKVRRHKLR